MQCVNLTDDELWQAIAHNTTAMSALVYRRIELDAGNTRNDVIDPTQLMQSNLETISKLERKYREYTDELCRRYPYARKQPVATAIEMVAVEVIEQPPPSVITAEGQGIMNVLRSLWASAWQLCDVRSNPPRPSRA